MIHYSKQVKWLVFAISLVLGAFIGYITYDAPVSQTLFKLRIILAIGTVFVALFAFIGIKLIAKFNINDELVLDDEMEDYFDLVESRFKTNAVLSVIFGIILFVITFLSEFHAPVMMPVCIIYYFLIIFLLVIPTMIEIITCVKMTINYMRIS